MLKKTNLVEGRRLLGDWYDAVIPKNVILDPQAHLETTYSFKRYRSRAPIGLQMDAGAAAYTGTMFDAGPRGQIRIGCCSMLNGAWLICDDRIDIGDHVLISWNVVLMDSYRESRDPGIRRRQLERFWNEGIEDDGTAECRAIRIESTVWIGFDSVILPGVTIGEGSIVGCRSVVTEDIPPFTIAAGNPARIVRQIHRGDFKGA